MKLLNLSSLALALGLPLLAAARPATPNPVTVVNPDGSKISVRLYGDENFDFMTDLDTNAILEYDKAGFVVPALRDGVQLTVANGGVARLSAERTAAPVKTVTEASRQHRMAELDKNGRTTYNTKGDVRGLVILLEYPDVPFSMADPNKQFDRLCNEAGYSDFEARGSARDYFMSVSENQFRPHFDVYGPVKLKNPADYYVGYGETELPGANHHARMGVAIQEALEALDPTVNFADYDLDGNGLIDNVFFFYSGYGQADTGDKHTIWPHQGDYRFFTSDYMGSIGLSQIDVDGVRMATYACSNELDGSSRNTDRAPWLDGIGAFVHEYSHVLGLPDLYDVLYSKNDPTTIWTKTPGYYDVMDHGNYAMNSTCPVGYSAYEKWLCNWLEYTDAADNTEYTLKPCALPGANCVRMRIRRPGGTNNYYTECYIAEYRDKSNWDAAMPEQGVYIWHINYTKDNWSGNRVNVNGKANWEMVGPAENDGVMSWPGPDGLFSYIEPSMPTLVPYIQKKALDVYITGMSVDEETNTAKLRYNMEKPMAGAPLLHDKPTCNRMDREIYISWDAVPGATAYLVTVKRKDALGREFIVSSLNEKNVGDVTSYAIRNLNSAYWDSEITAYVRAFNGFPCTDTSNVISFIPNTLEEGSGVDEIEEDALQVYGGQGCIIAPEGAKVYNIGGMATGTENLPAGVYIVTLGGKQAKVVVR